jgi:hypothetical protein
MITLYDWIAGTFIKERHFPAFAHPFPISNRQWHRLESRIGYERSTPLDSNIVHSLDERSVAVKGRAVRAIGVPCIGIYRFFQRGWVCEQVAKVEKSLMTN